MRQRTIRLISFDMDGTMLNEKGQIGTYTRKVLRKAYEKGLILVPNTGRSLAALLPVLPECCGIKMVSVLNGAYVFETKRKICLCEKPLNQAVMKMILKRMPKINGYAVAVINQYYFADSGVMEFDKMKLMPSSFTNAFQKEIMKYGLMEAVERSGYSVDKLVIAFPSAEEKYKTLPIFEKFPEVKVSYAHETNLEINQRSATKGNALQFICEYYGIAKEETMVIGDNNNDISMFEAGGFRVAVENANNELLRMADYIADSNQQEGAARAIEKLIL